MLDTEIRGKLAEYLNSEISLRQFQEWFVPATWDIQTSEPAHILDLAYSIQLKLAEYASDHLTENDLRQALIPYIERFTIMVSFPAISSIPSQVRAHLTGSSRILHPDAGRPREVVLAL